MTIDDLITGILQREGWPTVTARAADAGRLSKGGIRFDLWQARTGGSEAAFLALTEPEARAYYYHAYVVAPHLDGLPEPLRTLVVDWYVTSGDDATRALQVVLEAHALYRGRIDGVVGPQTIAALAADVHPQTTYRAVAIARVDFYQVLALIKDPAVQIFLAAHPTSNLHNLRGWTRRAAEFLR